MFAETKMPEILFGCEGLQEECCGRWASYAGTGFGMSLCEIASLSTLNIRLSVVRNISFFSLKVTVEVRTDPIGGSGL